jgi:hypothetical protein
MTLPIIIERMIIFIEGYLSLRKKNQVIEKKFRNTVFKVYPLFFKKIVKRKLGMKIS